MKFYSPFKIFLILVVACLFGASLTHAQMSKAIGKGEAFIENGNMRTAYNAAVNDALVDAIREYYGNAYDNSTDNATANLENLPDITPEYLKFIKSYKITSRVADQYKINVGVEVSLDTFMLNDASNFINKRMDTAVFTFSSILGTFSDAEISAIVNRTLQSKNFSTMDQSNFSYSLTNSKDTAQLMNAFSSVSGRYLFNFDFVVKYPETEESQNKCEVTTTTDIKIKHGEEKALKVSTGSTNTDKHKCVSEAVAQGVSLTIDYVRENIIQQNPDTLTVQSYKIRVTNFKNMISTNKFFATLSQKGLVNSYKVDTFSSKEIIFSVESNFEPNELNKKIIEAKLNNTINITTESNELVIDFDAK